TKSRLHSGGRDGHPRKEEQRESGGSDHGQTFCERAGTTSRSVVRADRPRKRRGSCCRCDGIRTFIQQSRAEVPTRWRVIAYSFGPTSQRAVARATSSPQVSDMTVTNSYSC